MIDLGGGDRVLNFIARYPTGGSTVVFPRP